MRIRAVILDVYHTLLEVGPPPADAAAGWEALWRDSLGRPPRLDLAAFAADCDRVVAREHAAARDAGIPHPEVFWPDVVREVVPELGPAAPDAVGDFILRQTGLWHTVRLMPGAAATLRELRQHGLPLGLASNAQPYTRRELDDALRGAGLDSGLFRPDLCFWSYAHGFSKPDPHVFRLLSARLQALGVAPRETLMVGDRLDNDLAPARAQGWQAWQISPPGAESWSRLREHLAASTASA